MRKYIVKVWLWSIRQKIKNTIDISKSKNLSSRLISNFNYNVNDILFKSTGYILENFYKKD